MKHKNNAPKENISSDDIMSNTAEDVNNSSVCNDGSEEGSNNNEIKSELDELKLQLESKTKQCEEYYIKLQRSVAEFDNYKKRTAREKENIYNDAAYDVVAAFLPVIDNMARASEVISKAENAESLKEGIEMVFKQLTEVMKGLGVKEIDCVGQPFDPELHNAVMHIEDSAFGESIVAEELRKGYLIKDKVLRHSMVKVAN